MAADSISSTFTEQPAFPSPARGSGQGEGKSAHRGNQEWLASAVGGEVFFARQAASFYGLCHAAYSSM